MQKAKVGNDHGAQHNAVPAEQLKVVVANVVKQKLNGEVGHGEGYDDPRQQDDDLAPSKRVSVKEVLEDFQ